MKYLKSYLLVMIAILGFSHYEAKGLTRDTSADALIEKRVTKELRKLPYYGVFDHISFEVNDGTVTLYGKVLNGINRKNAESYVEDIEGVTGVINKIELLPPSSLDDSIRRRTVRAFLSGGSIYRYLQEPNPSVRIVVERGRLTLEGFVNNEGDLRLANILARGVSGTFEVTSNLMVRSSDL